MATSSMANVIYVKVEIEAIEGAEDPRRHEMIDDHELGSRSQRAIILPLLEKSLHKAEIDGFCRAAIASTKDRRIYY